MGRVAMTTRIFMLSSNLQKRAIICYLVWSWWWPDFDHTHLFWPCYFSRASQPVCPCFQCVSTLLLGAKGSYLKKNSDKNLVAIFDLRIAFLVIVLSWTSTQGSAWVQLIMFGVTGSTLNDWMSLVGNIWILFYLTKNMQILIWGQMKNKIVERSNCCKVSRSWQSLSCCWWAEATPTKARWWQSPELLLQLLGEQPLWKLCVYFCTCWYHTCVCAWCPWITLWQYNVWLWWPLHTAHWCLWLQWRESCHGQYFGKSRIWFYF